MQPKDFPQIEYFGNGVLTPGNHTGYTRDQDNPLSDQFIPVEDRDEMGKARFWALMARREHRPAVTVMDPPGET